MDFEEQRRILKQKQAGFAVLRQLEIDQMRKATFGDRLDGFRRIMGFVEHLNRADIEDRRCPLRIQLALLARVARDAAGCNLEEATCTTLLLWTQIVGKIRLERSPLINHYLG